MNPAQISPGAPRTSLLGGLRVDDLLRRATRRTGSESRAWGPPSVEDLPAVLPAFRLEALAGRGGMGAVYAAWQPALGRRVAIRLLARSLLTADGLIKIADFGLAAPRQCGHSQGLTLTGAALWTVEYAAPEQWEGATADHRADIFSLGAISYELLTGARPRGAFDPPSRFPGVNRWFDEVITRALQRDPAQRQQSVDEFATGMARAASEALLASQDEE